MRGPASLQLPAFELGEACVGRRKRKELALIHEMVVVEVRRAAPTDVEVYRYDASLPHHYRLEELFFRSCLTKEGVPFRVYDLRAFSQISPSDQRKYILDERDHPLRPLNIRDGGRYPVASNEPMTGTGRQNLRFWAERLTLIDDIVVRPADPPGLCVGFDRYGSRLVTCLELADTPSLALRMPTLHLQATTPLSSVNDIGRILGIENFIADDDWHRPAAPVPTRLNWMQRTLSGLARYQEVKGPSTASNHIGLADLPQIAHATSLLEPADTAADCHAILLDTNPADFGKIEPYVADLQALILAYYQVMGEAVPVSPTSFLKDLVV